VGVSIAKAMASHSPLPSLNTLRCHSAGSSFGPNAMERKPRGCAQSDEHHQDMQAGSLVVVWELQKPKLWCNVCGVGARGRAPPQAPLEVVEGRERASMRMCAERNHLQKMQAGSLVAVWELA
jgi:hypothetical protein